MCGWSFKLKVAKRSNRPWSGSVAEGTSRLQRGNSFDHKDCLRPIDRRCNVSNPKVRHEYGSEDCRSKSLTFKVAMGKLYAIAIAAIKRSCPGLLINEPQFPQWPTTVHWTEDPSHCRAVAGIDVVCREEIIHPSAQFRCFSNIIPGDFCYASLDFQDNRKGYGKPFCRRNQSARMGFGIGFCASLSMFVSSRKMPSGMRVSFLRVNLHWKLGSHWYIGRKRRDCCSGKFRLT